MSLTYEINKHDLDAAMKAIEKTGADMKQATPRIVSDATTLAYRKATEIISRENIRRTGLYSKSTRMDVKDLGLDSEGIVANAARDPKTHFPYPQVIEHGSRPHVITPTVAKALRFVSKSGGVVYARKVQHPGTKPRHVFKRARDFAVQELPRLVKEFLQKAGKL